MNSRVRESMSQKFVANPFRNAMILLFGGFLVAGCGSQSFVVANLKKNVEGGHFLVPAKVDIVFAEDDTGSIMEAYPDLTAQIPGFLEGLKENGWDYHFATIPLTQTREFNQILASNYDGNWATEVSTSLWAAPFPGADFLDPKIRINQRYFRTPQSYSDFLNPQDLSNSYAQYEPGFQRIREFFNLDPSDTDRNLNLSESKFLRPDALSIVVVVSNGEDSSGVTFCERESDGRIGPCEEMGYPEDGTMESSFQEYRSSFLSLARGDQTANFKFYAAVATSDNGSCLGSRAYRGNRYIRMAGELAGGIYDLCSQPISTVLEGLSQNLHNIRLQLRVRYLILEEEPIPSSIVITKFPKGDRSKPIVLENSSTNGWTLLDGIQSVYTIDDPIPMNEATGYVIELHGDAKIVGDDQVDVYYKPVGSGQDAPIQ